MKTWEYEELSQGTGPGTRSWTQEDAKVSPGGNGLRSAHHNLDLYQFHLAHQSNVNANIIFSFLNTFPFCL